MEIDKNSQPQIDAVFQKMMQAQSSVEDEAAALWESGFKAKVAQQNFFHFGWGHYNIFTLGSAVLIAVCVVVGIVYVATRPLESGQPERSSSAIVVDHKDSVAEEPVKLNSGKKQKDTYPSTPKIQGTPSSETTRSGSTDTTTSILNTATAPVLETTPPPVTPTEPVRKEPILKKEKRTVMIEKRDTLQAVDTIRSKREWKKIFKNK